MRMITVTKEAPDEFSKTEGVMIKSTTGKFVFIPQKEIGEVIEDLVRLN